jgi:hypothetical protein
MTVCSNSCDSDYIFEKELYKQVISLICSDTYNVLSDTQELTGEEVESYIAVSVGGTGTTSTDIRLAIVEDETKLVDYNFNNYDADVSRYAQRLPVWRYTIDDAHIIVPKGERTGKMKIKFNPNGLSPDTAYFLPLAIASTSAYEINQKKNYLMYRVLIKNFYAQQQSAATSYTLYSDNGMKGSVSFSLNKQVQPLTKNSVRMMAGDLEFKSTVASYEAGAIVVTVGDDNKLTIKPYKEDGTLQVTQVDGDANYPNTFTLENDWGTKWKKFLLHYKYKAGTAAEVDMREELKLEYTDED